MPDISLSSTASLPTSNHLAPYLFSWTPHSIICITTILLGCYIRLSAFSALGSNFTFRLAAPKKLVTSGLYNYVQHPSYTGKSIIILANWALIQSPDGPVGCWLPAWVVEAKLLWRALACLIVFGATLIAWKRVKEEEMNGRLGMRGRRGLFQVYFEVGRVIFLMYSV
jgi:protein-S-isoprenylcysteine O-methyltransferase Ste14